ncbi:MAG TPA: ATP-dependent DNA helicase, partial [Candidatus Woesearchaeota archaeon]|nr:ATP-dependent DNA helicase [Candidatus Woesearchaeota archaeon]
MVPKHKLAKLLFPHSVIRNIQDDMLLDVDNVVKNKKCLIMHAPTGIGKTAGVLAPVLAYAIKNKLTIFFLTNRHTQHVIAIDTLKKIKEKYNLNIKAADIIGKKWMCPVPGIERLYSSEFAEYCKTVREDNKCEFYANTRKKSKPTVKAKAVLSELKQLSPCHIETVKDLCSKQKLCPYEISALMARDANVIITDYYYIFSPTIRDSFFKRIQKDINETIIIVDEGHNLSLRVRDLMTERLSIFMVKRAISEAKKFKYNEAKKNLIEIKNILENLAKDIKENREALIRREEFAKKVNMISDYDDLISDFEFIGDAVRETKKQSSIGSIARFLNTWQGSDEGFVRIIEKKPKAIILSYRCLDPSLVTRDVINSAHSTIIMSGTLTPTTMYRDLLGFEKDTVEKLYKSPFPIKNRLNLIIPETSTKYSLRNEKQFRRIAKICADIVNEVPGNSALFFPSYYLRDAVNHFFTKLCRKTTFLENPNLNKEEKKELLEKFKSYKDSGAVLLCVASGSFGEGIDLPGVLKCVVVIGIPLQKPDLEARALIDYYDKKFGKGWDYGYMFPAF